MSNQEALNEDSFYFTSPKGLRLHARSWKVNKARACLVGVHGYTEHSGCYRHFAEFLNQFGCDVYWIDLPGHGKSEGGRSDISRFSDYVESLEKFISEVKARSDIAPNLLFAHSLGALVSLRLLQTSSIASDWRVALSSPLLGLSEECFHGLGSFLQNPVGLFILEALTTILPNLTLPNEKDLGGSVLTHDPAMQRRRKQDPLMRSVVTIHWTREFLRARRAVFREVQKIQNPIAIFQAGEDFVVSRKATEKFFSLLESPEKKLRIYEGLWHELVNEVERLEIMSEMRLWLQLGLEESIAQGSI